MRRAAAVVVLGLAAGCAGEVGPRPQTVLHVDTDVPLPWLADTLRVELLRGLEVVSSATWVRPSPADWPVSFRIVPQDGGPTLLRLRLYGASHVAGRNPSALTEGLAADDPLPWYAIDRLVEIAPRSRPPATVSSTSRCC